MAQSTEQEPIPEERMEGESVTQVDPAHPEAQPVTSNEVGETSHDVEDDDSPADPVAEDVGRALNEARELAAERWNELLRTQAELENFRKRSRREVENAHKFGLERLVSELLPIRDGLELGLAAAGQGSVDIVGVCEGLELTLKMLNAALEKFGVEEINPVDGRFDPEFHQAMSMQEVAGKDSGQITMVVQKGFLLNGRLVRPAMVIVAK